MKILVTEVMWDGGSVNLNNQGVMLDYMPTLYQDRKKLLSVIGTYDGLIVRNQTVVDEELIQKGNRLKVIGRLGVGVDNININKAKEQNIKVIVARHANATSVAEYVLAAMLDAYKGISVADVDVKKGNWDRTEFIGKELKGKTIGLFGLGEISHRVSSRAKAFGMRVIGYDPFVSPYDYIIDETGVELFEMIDAFLKSSDFISVHVPLTKTTNNFFNKNMLNKMKKSAVLINTSRGGIINESDLYHAVEDGVIAGAYLDVLNNEPVQKDNPLLSLSSVHLTPHIAGLTDESQERISLLILKETMAVLQGEESLYLVK